MRLHAPESDPAPRPCVRVLLWAAASWGASLALLAAWFGARAARAVAAGGAPALPALVAAPWLALQLQAFATMALAPLLPALAGWALAASRLPSADRSWWAVGAGTAALGALAAAVVAPVLGDAVARWALVGFAWACLLAPRVACRTLRPGAFGRPGAPAT